MLPAKHVCFTGKMQVGKCRAVHDVCEGVQRKEQTDNNQSGKRVLQGPAQAANGCVCATWSVQECARLVTYNLDPRTSEWADSAAVWA